MRMKKGTYLYTVLLALDRFSAAILFNRPDITISSLCWVVLNFIEDDKARAAYAELKLNIVQEFFLYWVGKALEAISKGHCAQARLTDIGTAETTRSLLGEP